MLQTQVAYWQNVETNRHNLVTESQNAIDLGIKQKSYEETVRHNQATENISWFNAQETQRHNYVSEDISWFNAQESQRHNLASESVAWFNASESKRHNRANEGIAHYNAIVGGVEAGIKSAQYQLNADEVGERIEKSRTEREKIAADTEKSKEEARTESSKRFQNWTSGARNISETVKSVSDIASTWVSYAGGGGESAAAAKTVRKAAKAAGRSKR